MKKKATKAIEAKKEIEIVEGDISLPARFPDASALSALCRTGLKAGLEPSPGTCPY